MCLILGVVYIAEFSFAYHEEKNVTGKKNEGTTESKLICFKKELVFDHTKKNRK